MSQEKLNHVVVGVLIDFMSFLRANQEEYFLFSSAEAVKEFLAKRNIEYSDPLLQWPERCSKTEARDYTKAKRIAAAMLDMKVESLSDDLIKDINTVENLVGNVDGDLLSKEIIAMIIHQWRERSPHTITTKKGEMSNEK